MYRKNGITKKKKILSDGCCGSMGGSAMNSIPVLENDLSGIPLPIYTQNRGRHGVRFQFSRSHKLGAVIVAVKVAVAETVALGVGHWAQTWNLSQAPQACLCKILLVRVKYLTKHTLFMLQFGLVCAQILGVELTRVSLRYK